MIHNHILILLIELIMTYIYLNIYIGNSTIYYYVGSHTWDGEGIDPSYIGSSSVATLYGWVPDKIEVLEVVEVDKSLRERYWIEKYATLYGIADCAALLSKSKFWVSKFKPHGQLINCHANDSSQMMSSEAQSRALETKRLNGTLELMVRRMRESLGDTPYTEEAMHKRCATVHMKGTSCYSPDVYKKRKATIEKRKAVDKTFRKQKIVRVTGNGIDSVGVLHRICVELGHPTWDTTIVQKFKSSNVVTHRGFTFEWVNKEI